jgi:hypothetical protein
VIRYAAPVLLLAPDTRSAILQTLRKHFARSAATAPPNLKIDVYGLGPVIS